MAEKATVDPTIYLTKAPTALQERFSTWIQEEVGYAPASAKTKLEAFEAGVRIATATRMLFQASDFNRAANAEAAEARLAREAAAEQEEKPTPAKKTAPAKKAAPAKRAAAKVVEPEADEDTEEEAAPAPVRKPARKPARRAAPTDQAPF